MVPRRLIFFRAIPKGDYCEWNVGSGKIWKLHPDTRNSFFSRQNRTRFGALSVLTVNEVHISKASFIAIMRFYLFPLRESLHGTEMKNNKKPDWNLTGPFATPRFFRVHTNKPVLRGKGSLNFIIDTIDIWKAAFCGWAINLIKL